MAAFSTSAAVSLTRLSRDHFELFGENQRLKRQPGLQNGSAILSHLDNQHAPVAAGDNVAWDLSERLGGFDLRLFKTPELQPDSSSTKSSPSRVSRK